MSRSYCKHDWMGITGCSSEKKDKQLANRALRHHVKRILHSDPETESPLPVMREVSNVWNMGKDGKNYFGDLLISNKRRFPHDSRAEDPYWVKIYRKMKSK
jgi:hypothetical protein